jgi:hypothetical protein
MYSQFSLVRFSSVALTTTSSKIFDCARNMASACFRGELIEDAGAEARGAAVRGNRGNGASIVEVRALYVVGGSGETSVCLRWEVRIQAASTSSYAPGLGAPAS